MMKWMKGKIGVDSNSSTTSYLDGNQPAFAHLTGINPIRSHSGTCCYVLNNCSSSWIVDIGASDHMTFNQAFFTQHTKPLKPIFVTLPDGTSKPVTRIGQIPLTSNLNLQNVSHVPDFKFNMLSINQILTTNNMCVTFFPDACVF